MEHEQYCSDRLDLLYVAPTAPHTPFTPEPRYEKARVRGWHGNPAVRESNESDKPRYVRLRDRQVKPGRKHRRQQFRTLMSVDDLIDQIARTLHYLKEHRRTLAVFTSDNGLLWSEHGLLGKDVPYTQAVHVPLLIRWPGHVRRSIDGRLVANIDIAPTVLRAAGLPLPVEPPLDGRNLLRQGWRRRHLLLEHWCNRRGNCKRWAAALGKGYEYVEYSPRGKTGFREFYRLRRDPWQLTNLLNDGVRANNPNTHRLHRRLQHARLCSGASCP